MPEMKGQERHREPVEVSLDGDNASLSHTGGRTKTPEKGITPEKGTIPEKKHEHW